MTDISTIGLKELKSSNLLACSGPENVLGLCWGLGDWYRHVSLYWTYSADSYKCACTQGGLALLIALDKYDSGRRIVSSR